MWTPGAKWAGQPGAEAQPGVEPRAPPCPPSLHAAVAPLARACRLLGLLALDARGGRFVRSGRQVAYAGAVGLFYVAVFVFCMRWRVHHLYVKMSAFMQYSDMLLWVTLLVADGVVIAVAALPRFSQRVCAIFDLVASVDRDILDDPAASYASIEKFLVWQLSLAFLLCNSIVISESVVLSEPGLWSAVYYFAAASIHMVFILVMLQFVDLALLLKIRFNVINKKLETFFNDDIESPWRSAGQTTKTSRKYSDGLAQESSIRNKVIETDVPAAIPLLENQPLPMQMKNINVGVAAAVAAAAPPSASELHRVGRAHLALCDAADLVNATYGAQILCCVATAFINVTATLFDCLHSFRQERSIMTEDVTLVFCCWVLVFVLQVGLVLAACSAAAGEADRAPRLLQRLQAQGAWPGGTLQAQARHLAAQAQARRVRFSACGLFRVDLSLACSMAQAVASYIVIMMQFDQQNASPAT